MFSEIKKIIFAVNINLMIQNKIKKIILQTIISHYQHQPYNNLSPWNNSKALLNLYKNPLNSDWILFPKFSLSCERMDDK